MSSICKITNKCIAFKFQFYILTINFILNKITNQISQSWGNCTDINDYLESTVGFFQDITNLTWITSREFNSLKFSLKVDTGLIRKQNVSTKTFDDGQIRVKHQFLFKLSKVEPDQYLDDGQLRNTGYCKREPRTKQFGYGASNFIAENLLVMETIALRRVL